MIKNLISLLFVVSQTNHFAIKFKKDKVGPLRRYKYFKYMKGFLVECQNQIINTNRKSILLSVDRITSNKYKIKKKFTKFYK